MSPFRLALPSFMYLEQKSHTQKLAPECYILTSYPTKMAGDFSCIYQVSDVSGHIRTDLIAKKIAYKANNMPFRNEKMAYSDFYRECYAAHVAGMFVDYEHQEFNQCFYLIMKKAEGKTLLDTLLDCCQHPFEFQEKGLARFIQGLNHLTDCVQKKAINTSELPGLFEAVKKAITQFHQRTGLVHQDLHPENIIVNKTAQGWSATLIDFGLCQPATLKNIDVDFWRVFTLIGATQDVNAIKSWTPNLRFWLPNTLGLIEVFFIAGVYSQGVPDSHLGLIMSALANGLVSRKIANKAEYYAMEFGAVAKQGLTVKRKRLRHYGAPESTLKNIFLDCFSEKDSALVLLVSYYLTNVLILSLNFYTLNLALEIAIPGPEVTLNSSLVSLITASVLGSYLAYQSYDGIKVNVNIIEQLVDLTLSSKEYMSFKLNGLTQKVEAKVTLDSPQKGLYFNHSAKDNVFLAKDLENRTRSALLNR